MLLAQDYSYWYGSHGEGGDPGVGGPFPDMVIGGLAIDKAHKGNGCLQMMRGSHKLGRLDSYQVPTVRHRTCPTVPRLSTDSTSPLSRAVQMAC